MAKDNERRSDSKSFSPSEQNSMKIANDATVKALTLDVTINLSTPAGLVAATNPIGEAPFNVIQSMFIDFDGRSRYFTSGVMQRLMELWKANIANLPTTTVVAPAAGTSNTIRFLLPFNFGLQRSDKPSLGFKDFSKYRNTYLNLIMGTISNLFGTPSDTTLDSINVDLYMQEILGITMDPANDVFIEPHIITENIQGSSADKKFELNIGDRSYIALFLRAETATDTPSNAVISGMISIKGSEPNKGIFSLRQFENLTYLQNLNTLKHDNNSYGTGIGIIDFISNGRLNGAIGTSQITDFSLNAGVTGGATSKLEIGALAIMR